MRIVTSLLLLLSALWAVPPQSGRPGAALGVRLDAVDATLDSAQAEMNAGRYWHASRILRGRSSGDDGSDPFEILLLARADAGWQNWAGVVRGLEDADWLDELDGGEGRLLLARGHEVAERWDEAAGHFARFRSYGSAKARGPWATSREARAAARSGRWEPALAALDALSGSVPGLESWTALELAELASGTGDVRRVRRLLPIIGGDSTASERAWDLEARAWLAAGDSARALEAYVDASRAGLTPARRGRAMTAIGGLSVARGDREAARTAYRASLDAYPRGASGARAAWGVLQLGAVDTERALSSARVLDRAREYRRALVGYDRYLAGASEAEPEYPGVRLARARLLSALERHEDAVIEFRELVKTDDPDFELRVLDQWLGARRRQGRRDAVRTIQGWVIERFPESRQAVDIVVSWANAALDRGAYAEAAAGFERAVGMAPSHSSAGLARMRLGQIHLQQDDDAAAARVFEGYVEDFPDGRRWDQAAYWAARSLGALNRDDEAREYIDMIRERSGLSYYGVLVSELLGEPFRPELPAGPSPAVPEWLVGEIEALDVLVAAGLDEGVEASVRRMIARADASVPVSLDVADALIERGFTVEGINVGWAVLGKGTPQTERLLRVLYPFPYREVVTREANERDIDPILLAALIRQESAFAPAIRSPAGAIGLMQVMPETGRQLARGAGIRGFTPLSLETPEINLHLGTTFWLDMERRYGDGSLPLVLSAYNAGPARARRWRRLPEADDPLRFTERIPFDETRGYVKNITRNMHLYQFLYGEN